MHGRASGRVWFREQLRGRLAEMSDLVFDGFSGHGIRDLVQIHRTLVSQIVEDVGRSRSFGTFLLVTGGCKRGARGDDNADIF